MSKRTTISFLLGASLAPLAAQQGFHIGPKFIPTAAWFLNEDDAGASDSQAAFGAGIDYHFNDGTGVGLDFIWSKETQTSHRDGVAKEIELSFFKLPLLLHFGSGSGDKIPFLGYVGVEYVKLCQARFVERTISFYSAGELYRETNFGAVVGLGPGWNINEKLQFSAIVRAGHLFNDPENKDASFFWGSERPKSSLFTLGLDLGLRLLIATAGR